MEIVIASIKTVDVKRICLSVWFWVEKYSCFRTGDWTENFYGVIVIDHIPLFLSAPYNFDFT